jgi:hypothetical protein
LDFKKKPTLRIKATQYQLINNVLFKKNYDSMLLRCLEKQEADKVLFDIHNGLAGGHFEGDTTTHKILHAGYYWMTLFKDSQAYVQKCKICQISTRRDKKPTLPFHPVIIEQPFEQWGLDIIGEIVPNSSKQHRYILTATDYFKKWVEAIPLKSITNDHVISFLDRFIITRFGLPSTLVFDNATYFSSL